MTTPQFVHLRLHSEYSIVDGLVRIDDVVKEAAKDGQAALGITDLSNLFGMVKFYKAARGKGVKPIIGCDVWISNDDDRDKPSRLLLLVKNNHGYLQLCDLLSRAWLTNLHRGRAEIRTEWLEELQQQDGGTGLIALSGAHFGDVGIAIENGNVAAAERCAQRWAAIFPDSSTLNPARRPAQHGYSGAAIGRAGGQVATAGGGDASDPVPDARRICRA